MAYNLDKRVNRDAWKSSNTVFNIGGTKLDVSLVYILHLKGLKDANNGSI